MNTFAPQPLPDWKRAVLKVGSSLLAADGGGLSPRHALGLAQFVLASRQAGDGEKFFDSSQLENILFERDGRRLLAVCDQVIFRREEME